MSGLAALLLALALAACTVDGQGTVAGNEPAPPNGAATLASLPPAQTEPPAPPPPPPELLGLEQADVIRILGKPVFRREDAPALLLRYRGEGCILDLFLYDSGDQDRPGPTTVEYVEARSEIGEKVITSPCVDAVIRTRTPADAG